MRYVFFDLDDTVYDRAVPFVRAFREFFGEQYSEDTAYRGYVTCNTRGQEVFADSQTGKISMRDMYIYRYKLGLADLGIDIDDSEALRIQELYKKYQKHLEMTPVMVEILNTCARRFDKTALLTNGPGQHQRDKAACLGMERWVSQDHIIVSGEVGVIKPDVRIFRIAEQKTGAVPKDTYMIGDSYESDIAGAIAAGWKSIWLNKKHLPIPEGSPAPDHEVASEEELAALMLTI